MSLDDMDKSGIATSVVAGAFCFAQPRSRTCRRIGAGIGHAQRKSIGGPLASDRALAARVAAWETQLSALIDGFAPAPAAPGLRRGWL